MRILLHLAAAAPACLLAIVAWRQIRGRKWFWGAVAGVLGLLCVFAHPAVQMTADWLVGYPYAKRREALALEHGIVGKNFAFVVEKLGEPSRVRVENPTVVTTATREITWRGATYQAMDYSLSPMIYTATRFIVFLDDKGTVTGHRVKWEYGQGR